MSKLSNLINLASEKNWCTRLYCTTCGALDFRRELRKQPNEEILEDLRALPGDFCDRHADVLRLIFVEVAIFPTYIDLINVLENTPAGAILDAAIRHSNRIEERRREYERWCSPEAAKERAITRQRLKATAHKLRLGKKVKTDEVLRIFRDALSQTDYSCFFAELNKVADPLVARAIGGLAYSALYKCLRNGNLSSEQTMLLERCASNFGGHWKRLMQEGYPGRSSKGSI